VLGISTILLLIDKLTPLPEPKIKAFEELKEISKISISFSNLMLADSGVIVIFLAIYLCFERY
jgi:hypothetical protein